MALKKNLVLQITDGSDEEEGTVSSNKNVVLVSSEGESFEIEPSVATQSQLLLSEMVYYGCVDDPILLPNVTSKTLAKVIEFCVKHAEIQNPEDLNAWDADFINIDLDVIFQLILAANYLHIKSLLDLTCQYVADMIKGNSVDELRRIFNIKNDFSAEEEKENRENYKWAFE